MRGLYANLNRGWLLAILRREKEIAYLEDYTTGWACQPFGREREVGCWSVSDGVSGDCRDDDRGWLPGWRPWIAR
jgi:hypothetical protein